MTNEELLSVAEIAERLATRFHKQAADHEAKMVEHRAAFGVRTEADAKIIAALREQVELANGECNVLRALTVDTAKYKEERDALRAEVAALQERLRASIARGDLAQMKVAALKSQTPKHPVRVGEYVTWRGSPGVLGGTIKQVAEIRGDRAYRFTDGGVWSFALCEPCDPPATHDTEAGKAAAAAAVKTEPVADEIKVGDVVEVFQSTASCTFKTDIGTRGTVLQLDDSCVDIAPLDVFLAPKYNHVALCDVWKVTT